MADKKSSLVQIHQDVLDEASQSLKVSVSVDGNPVSNTNPLPVVIDNQNIVVDVALDKDNDSVTAWQGGGAWAVTNTHITEPVATEASLTSVDGKLYSTDVAGNASLHVTVDNQNEGLATLTEQQTQTSKLTTINTKIDTSNTKLDSVISELSALNSKSARMDAVHTSYFSYDTINVTNAAWTTVTTIPANIEIRELAVFDSSGEVVEVGITNDIIDDPTTVKFLIFPGGNQPMPVIIPAGKFLKIRAKSVSLTTGTCIINYYGVSTL